MAEETPAEVQVDVQPQPQPETPAEVAVDVAPKQAPTEESDDQPNQDEE